LIPCRLITKHNIPSEVLLSSYPRLQKIFAPLFACIKRGDLSGFDDALVAGEAEFVRRRIYLTLERGRDIALRNLFRKVFLVGGFEDLKEGQTEKDRVRKTRIPIANFAAAMKIGMAGDGSGELLENDEVECMLANMIYKVRMQYTLRRIWVVTTATLIIPRRVPRGSPAWCLAKLGANLPPPGTMDLHCMSHFSSPCSLTVL
jgi:hypothetical protein